MRRALHKTFTNTQILDIILRSKFFALVVLPLPDVWHFMNTTAPFSLDTFIATALNQPQQDAVTHDAGPILVIAGAGSGKTRVITTRITYLLLKKQVPAHQIVALTFTNKAALEMKHRIQQFLPHTQHLPFIGTFHSYCVRLLRLNSHRLEHPFLSILDDDDQQKLLSTIIQKHGLQKQFTAKQVGYQISHIKNHLANPNQLPHELLNNTLMYDIYKAYEHEKRINRCLDFDDLLLETLKLFKHNADFKTEHQHTVRHILVDEYQDTNIVQHNLLKEMALNKAQLAVDSICAVGDEDQSIYSWRGATVTNILNFKTDFAHTTTVKIEQNYRSAQQILDAANHLIDNNRNRNPKTLWSRKQGVDRIRQLTCLTEYQEAEIIAQLLARAKQQKKLDACAVLYRTHAQSRALEEALVKHAIPYKIIGGIQFYERKEIKDLLAYLRLIINPFDRTSLMRVINSPTRGLGAKFEEQLFETWALQPFLTFTDALRDTVTAHAIPPAKQKMVHEFITIFEALDHSSSASDALQQIITRTRYIPFLTESCEPQDAQARIDNVQELINAVQYAQSTGTKTVTEFIEQVSLMQEKTTKQDELNTVVLMSLHAAKGLEFDIVIIAGLEETLLPSSRSLDNHDALEEERRLFYVGITRAKEHLLLTRAKHRYTYGRMVDQRASRFLHEIPQALVQTDDASYWKSYQIRPYFSAWLEHAPTVSPATPVTIQREPSTPRTEPTRSNLRFKAHQPVAHATYGTGIIEKIEEKSDNTQSITVRFKSGTKKIVSTFLRPV